MQPFDPARTIPRLAAAISAAVAGVYVLIATDVITVMEDQATESAVPPVAAAVMFAALAAGLALAPSRRVLRAGVALQVLAIALYFMIAAERTPSVEAWGLGLKVVQALLLVLLLSRLVPRHLRHAPGPHPAP